MSTLGHQYDNSLVSNAFGFLRLPMNFQPYDSDADWVITGVPFDIPLLVVRVVATVRQRSVRFRRIWPGNTTASRGISTCVSV